MQTTQQDFHMFAFNYLTVAGQFQQWGSSTWRKALQHLALALALQHLAQGAPALGASAQMLRRLLSFPL